MSRARRARADLSRRADPSLQQAQRHRIGPAVDGKTTFGYPNSGETILVMSESAPETTTCYQVWYRGTSGPCGGGSNRTNGYRIAWQ